MARIKLTFDNADGQALAGLLETPPDGVLVARYALFAHCFTCGKDIAAASRISRAMASRGIAVLRFGMSCEDGSGRVDRITRTLALEGDLTNEQRRRLIEIADRCPVHQTLEKEVRRWK